MVEFRLYYDDKGKVICYTCEDLEGTYIVIDAETYSACRLDVHVINEKIVSNSDLLILYKFVPGKDVSCASEDICILTEEGRTKQWSLKRYEF